MLCQSVYDPERLPAAVWSLIFNNVQLTYQNNPVKVQVVKMRSGGEIKKVTIGDFTYLEQNPNSSSKYGEMARRGQHILWIIHSSGKYVGRVIGGKVERL